MNLKFFLKKIILLCFMSFTNIAYSASYFKIQHAGEIGYYSLGLSHNFNYVYSLEIFHGIVPAYMNQRAIETVSIKNNFNMFIFTKERTLNKIYSGISFYHVKGKRYDPNTSTTAPNNYYRKGSIRAQLYLGVSTMITGRSSHGLYFESGVNDIVLINYVNNLQNIEIQKYTFLAVGYCFYLNL